MAENKGLAESRAFFREKGLALFREKFPEIFPRLAFGLAGHGSECYGFDDEISRDHDFTRGFAVWLTDADEEKYGFHLMRAYQALLKESGAAAQGKSSALGESEHGICRISTFFERHTGLNRAPETWQEWFYTPGYAFAEAVNGEVFLDGPGLFSAIRQKIRHGMPEDVRLKKIASRTALMAQTGQYNYARSLRRKEEGAAMLALGEFVRNCGELLFLLSGVHAPYYKWFFRAMRSLPDLGELAYPLEFLLCDPGEKMEKTEMIGDICHRVRQELRQRGFSQAEDEYLESHAFEVMKKIRTPEIRALHVMEG